MLYGPWVWAHMTIMMLTEQPVTIRALSPILSYSRQETVKFTYKFQPCLWLLITRYLCQRLESLRLTYSYFIKFLSIQRNSFPVRKTVLVTMATVHGEVGSLPWYKSKGAAISAHWQSHSWARHVVQTQGSVQPSSEKPRRHFQGKPSHEAITSQLNQVLYFVLKWKNSRSCPQ